jgi:hypothetical protein
MTASNKENLDPEVNSIYSVEECIDESVTDDSVCTKNPLSSIPIEKDIEVIELTKTTKSKETFRTDKQFKTQGKQRSYKVSVPPRAIYLDIQVEARVHKNNKLSLTIYTPKRDPNGPYYGTGSITHRISGSKYVQQGDWMLAVSGDDDYTIKSKALK